MAAFAWGDLVEEGNPFWVRGISGHEGESKIALPSAERSGTVYVRHDLRKPVIVRLYASDIPNSEDVLLINDEHAEGLALAKLMALGCEEIRLIEETDRLQALWSLSRVWLLTRYPPWDWKLVKGLPFRS
ncbi:MAG: hypothetical protein Q7S31_00845 [bacterium]|nr:hypothetical protein [bacterium]